MAVPNLPQPGRGSGPGYGPFGRLAFRLAFGSCLGLIVAGGLAGLLLDGAVAALGTSLAALGTVAVATVGLLMALERLQDRRRRAHAPPPAPREGGPHPPGTFHQNGRAHRRP